jgi:hypothetical protein
MGRDLNPATFNPHVRSEFKVVEAPEPELHVELTEVRALGHQPRAPRPDPFALTFSGPSDRALRQQTHRLSHPVLGELEIFLVPIGPDADGRLMYEAVFN